MSGGNAVRKARLTLMTTVYAGFNDSHLTAKLREELGHARTIAS